MVGGAGHLDAGGGARDAPRDARDGVSARVRRWTRGCGVRVRGGPRRSGFDRRARDAVAVVFSSDDGAAKLVAAVVAFAIGWVLWGFLEYAFHRFAFHRTPRGRLGIVAHFVAHGCHHKAPMDRWRLVFPPAASAPVIYAAGLAFDAVAPTQWLALFAFAGCLLGYVAYDCSHYAMHHAEFGWSRALAEKKSTHMAHHYVDCERSFGITSTFFDRVAGTHPETRDGGIRGRERGVEKPKVS